MEHEMEGGGGPVNLRAMVTGNHEGAYVDGFMVTILPLPGSP